MSRNQVNRRQEKQATSAQDRHGNQDAENAGKNGQPQQFPVTFQDGEAVPDEFPGLSDPSDGALLLRLEVRSDLHKGRAAPAKRASCRLLITLHQLMKVLAWLE